jgi:hypothetical protein
LLGARRGLYHPRMLASRSGRAAFVLGVLAVAVAATGGADDLPAPTPGLTLWYDKPSEKWTDALPLGNGRMGAMVFGGTERERLQLNENTLYSGEPPADLRTIDITKDFDHVLGLIRAGNNSAADAYVSKHWLGSAATSSAISRSVTSSSTLPPEGR